MSHNICEFAPIGIHLINIFIQVPVASYQSGRGAEQFKSIMEFIHQPCDFFSRDDLRTLQSMERIRNASDYDDFYVANKAECEDQVKKARQLLRSVSAYLESQGII